MGSPQTPKFRASHLPLSNPCFTSTYHPPLGMSVSATRHFYLPHHTLFISVLELLSHYPLTPKLKKTCHPEPIRQGPVCGLRWCSPEIGEGPQLEALPGDCGIRTRSVLCAPSVFPQKQKRHSQSRAARTLPIIRSLLSVRLLPITDYRLLMSLSSSL